MRHPALPDQPIDVDPIAVPHHQAAGWQVVEGQEEQGETWPAELQRFEGQEQVRMRHPDLVEEITVSALAVPFHQERGWYRVEEDVPLPDVDAEVPDDLDGLTVPDLQDLLRARDLPTSGKRAELLERLRTPPATEAPVSPAEESEA